MEVCIDNIQSAINAAASGASRIELCTALSEGGLTPSTGFLKMVKQSIHIPVFVMLRPRRGNFVYTRAELEIMKLDAVDLKNAGADGVVFGILKEDGSIDESACREVLSITYPLPATFHRAFDVTQDPIGGLETIINLGFSRILTSGQKPHAADGLDLIRQLVERSRGRIIIMPGSGINENNIGQIMETGVREVHASARSAIPLNFQSNTEVAMGSTDDNVLLVTDMNIVRTIVSIVEKYIAK